MAGHQQAKSVLPVNGHDRIKLRLIRDRAGQQHNGEKQIYRGGRKLLY
jgi:hypothetical protein